MRLEEKRYAVKTVVGDALTPISIFQSISGRKKCLLESSLKHEESGRYSFIAADPFAELIGKHGDAVISSDIKQFDTLSEKPISKLKKMLKYYQINTDQSPVAGGAIGYIGYDEAASYEKIGMTPDDELEMPDTHLMFYSTVISYDHKRHEVTIFTFDPEEKKSDEELVLEIDEIISQIFDFSSVAAQPEKTEVLQYQSNMEKSQYEQYVEEAKEYIRAGDIFQVVLSQRLSAPFNGSPFSFYRNLRKDNPSPYMFYIDFEDYIVLGASPESLIKVSGRQVTTNPIAGTRRRGKTEQQDQQLAEELLNDEKECAEHKMLVDLGRNDLGRVCETGSISLSKFMVIERYQHVMHIVSEVKGVLKPEIDGLDALIAALPAGTVSGAPKIRAMQLINQFEPVKRGVYAGAVGYAGFNGALDFALAIRTMVIKDQVAHVQAGAGIVYDSVPESEYQETLNKAKSLLEVGR
ncbi:anthranilate synthase [Jeotgalibacillus malaysiensis]|uniref:Anthranilate synthase component 1 n=1 Tax=Jeotgalibacillus malaysiensis TaxID=1508404 RepID=A0A0B5ALR8_9BACL|nr:anthranilate synthase component I [Jeotgalibacillus malaysiensis]AJD91200.1 anthranilate synthase [Jeotgalibacillus malaysiensis]